MKKGFLIIILCLLAKSFFGQQFTDLYSDYFEQTPPGDTPVVFAPRIVSTVGNNEHTLSVSPDGNEIYFTRDPLGRAFIMKRQGKTWSDPVLAAFTGREAIFPPDGLRLFYNDVDICNKGDIYWVSTKVIDNTKKIVFNTLFSPKEIHDAAASGDLIKVKMLLEADPTLLELKDDRAQRNIKDKTPLISACWGPGSNNWQPTVANYLIDKGANVNAKNEIGAIGDDLAKEEHKKCVEKLRAGNIPVFYPKGG